MTARTFDDRLAIREKTPILVGLVGPSGTGKTYSALRLAAGFQRVTGGETYVIDTEARRSLHYAEKFKFRHVDFGAPFSPLDYLDAIRHCVDRGATTIIVDSMSHEHEGPGGVLEMHTAEHARLGGRDGTKMLAWARPKQDRRRLINSILQMSCNFIFCFRAKEKLKIEKGKDPAPLGFMPLGAEEFIYEQTINCLLLPAANGAPIWNPMEVGEKAIAKLPEQFRETFAKSPQLTEDIGELLATWAGGVKVAPMSAEELIRRFDACASPAEWRALEEVRRVSWDKLKVASKPAVKAAVDAATERLAVALESGQPSTPADESKAAS